MLKAGDRVADYDLEELVGRGPTGAVFRARDSRLGRLAALRIVASDLVDDPVHRARLNREASVLAQLDHPNVPPLYDAEEADGTILLASRWVDGMPLDALVAENGPLEPIRAVRLVSQIAAALQTAHDMGLVHRAVKPSHVLVTPGDHAYLTDFGLTRRAGEAAGLTDPADLVSTLDYVAPELVRGDEVDARVDIYGLGLVLYEALTGAVPFPRLGDAAKLYAQASVEVPSLRERRPDLPPELDAVVLTALSKDPAARQPSAAEFAEQASAAVATTVPGWVAASSSRGSSTPFEPLAPPGGLEMPPGGRRRGPLARWMLLVVGLAVFLAAAAALVLALRDTAAGAQTEKVAAHAYGLAAAGERVFVATGRGGLAALPDTGDSAQMRRVLSGKLAVRDVASDGRRTVATTKRALVSVPRAGQADRGPAAVRIPGAPRALAQGAGASWIGLADRNTLLQVKDGVTTSIPLLEPAIAIAVGAEAVWVAGAADGTVFGMDPETLETTTEKIRVGRRPVALAATANAIWVVLAGDGQLIRLDPRTGRPKGAPVPIPGKPSAVAADAREVWVTRSADDAVTQIDARTGRPQREVGTAARPVDVTLTRDVAWVVGARGEVTRIPR